jgi:hypothetical protein
MNREEKIKNLVPPKGNKTNQEDRFSFRHTKPSERILRKTIEVIERPIVSQKTFTTRPLIRRKKTGHKLVRRIAQELVDSWYPETVVSYDAMDRRLITKFERCDKKTRLNYLGRPATRQVEHIDQEVRYRKTGTVTYKDHTFTHRLPKKKGYIEIFGLATLFTDKKRKAWFRLHHTIQETFPPATPLPRVMNDSFIENGSNKISLPLNSVPNYSEGQLDSGYREGRDREKRESILTERENRSSESILTLEERRILKIHEDKAR